MKLIDGREFRDRMSSLPWKSARWVSFRVALTSNPISAGLSVERTIVIFGRVRYGFVYDAQVGKSGAPISPSGYSNEGLMDEAECTPKWCQPQLRNLDSLELRFQHGLDCRERLFERGVRFADHTPDAPRANRYWTD